MSERRRPKLTPQAKALFLHASRYTKNDVIQTFSYHLKFPAISKGFLLAARDYKVYSLRLQKYFEPVYSLLLQKYSEPKYSMTIENANECISQKTSKMYSMPFHRLQNLSRLLRVSYIDIVFDMLANFYMGETLRGSFVGLRQVWNELYPEARINLVCNPMTIQFDDAMVLIEELATRLYRLECSSRVLDKAPQLKLDFCVVNTDLDIECLKRVLQKHKIKNLRLKLSRMNNNLLLIPHQSLNNFPSNSTLEQIEIGYQKEHINESEDLGAFDSLPQFFPHLKNLRAVFTYKEPKDHILCSVQQISQIFNNSLDHIRALRERFVHHASSLFNLEIFSCIDCNVNTSLEEFNTWIASIENHKELGDADCIEPAFDFDPDRRFPLNNLAVVGPFTSYYKYVMYDMHNIYHRVCLRWKRKNFTGIIQICVKNFSDR